MLDKSRKGRTRWTSATTDLKLMASTQFESYLGSQTLAGAIGFLSLTLVVRVPARGLLKPMIRCGVQVLVQ
jgi:hypothetical protein